ncbi:MAG: TonB-dependent receptor [Gammaproteobacteria bacterium]|nr:TonB-dependent receptor [Gammaproteobacteria bacterium]
MSFKRRAAVSAFVASMVLSSAVWSQQTAGSSGADDDRRLETVVVTGSSIKRKVTESALPIQVLSTEDIRREGINSPEQLISYLNSNGNGLDNLASNADVVGGAQRGNNGASSANLRGQGSAATLILLNGRRVAAHGLNGGAVDINQIPLAAIDRVEILKDGASAIYGTDAIGGVINFILKTNYQGLTANAFGDVTDLGGGAIYRASITGGIGDVKSDGWNVMATVSYNDFRELRGDARSFVNTFQPERGVSVDTRGTPSATILPLGVGPNTPLGTIINSSGTAPFLPGSTTIRASGGINPLDLPGGGGCNQIDGMQAYDTKLWNFPEAEFACAWDTGRAAVLQQPIETINFVSRGVLQLGAHQIAAEITGSTADSAKRFSNLQLTPNTSTQNYAFPRNAASQAVYDRVFNQLVAVFPTLEARRGLPMSYRWRCIECGRREIETTTDTGRVFLGADGPIGFLNDWEYRTGASYAYSEAESQLGTGYYYRNTTRDASGSIIANGIIDALNTGVINPFLRPGESQSQAALDLLKGASAEGVILYGGKFSVTQIDASMSGPLFSMGTGDVLAAVGVDWRKEEYRFNGDRRAAAARPIIIAAPFDDGNALAGVSRNVKAVYGEVMVPLVTGMELTAAVRRDEYDGFGSTVNPKISVKYRPADFVMFRGSYNEGFRVPSFNQIFNASSQAPYSGRDIADPAKCVGGRPDATKPECAVVQPTIIQGGKPDLGPEEAEQATFGIVLEANDYFSVSADWWRVNRIGTIQILSLQQLADNYTTFSDRYGRGASGNLISIDQRWVNAGESKTRGLELAMRLRGEAWGGNWSAGLDGTKMLQKRSRIAPSLPLGRSEIGLFTFAGDLGLDWKHNAYFTFTRGDWSASISQIYRSSYLNQELPGVTAGIVSPPNLDRFVDTYITYNASVTWKGFDGLTVTAGIKNLLNKDPPFAITYDSNFGSGSSWEPRVADPRNRSFTLLMEYKF